MSKNKRIVETYTSKNQINSNPNLHKHIHTRAEEKADIYCKKNLNRMDKIVNQNFLHFQTINLFLRLEKVLEIRV